eukprot:gene981-1498_t
MRADWGSKVTAGAARKEVVTPPEEPSTPGRDWGALRGSWGNTPKQQGGDARSDASFSSAFAKSTGPGALRCSMSFDGLPTVTSSGSLDSVALYGGGHPPSMAMEHTNTHDSVDNFDEKLAFNTPDAHGRYAPQAMLPGLPPGMAWNPAASGFNQPPPPPPGAGSVLSPGTPLGALGFTGGFAGSITVGEPQPVAAGFHAPPRGPRGGGGGKGHGKFGSDQHAAAGGGQIVPVCESKSAAFGGKGAKGPPPTTPPQGLDRNQWGYKPPPPPGDSAGFAGHPQALAGAGAASQQGGAGAADYGGGKGGKSWPAPDIVPAGPHDFFARCAPQMVGGGGGGGWPATNAGGDPGFQSSLQQLQGSQHPGSPFMNSCASIEPVQAAPAVEVAVEEPTKQSRLEKLISALPFRELHRAEAEGRAAVEAGYATWVGTIPKNHFSPFALYSCSPAGGYGGGGGGGQVGPSTIAVPVGSPTHRGRGAAVPQRAGVQHSPVSNGARTPEFPPYLASPVHVLQQASPPLIPANASITPAPLQQPRPLQQQQQHQHQHQQHSPIVPPQSPLAPEYSRGAPGQGLGLNPTVGSGKQGGRGVSGGRAAAGVVGSGGKAAPGGPSWGVSACWRGDAMIVPTGRGGKDNGAAPANAQGRKADVPFSPGPAPGMLLGGGAINPAGKALAKDPSSASFQSLPTSTSASSFNSPLIPPTSPGAVDVMASMPPSTPEHQTVTNWRDIPAVPAHWQQGNPSDAVITPVGSPVTIRDDKPQQRRSAAANGKDPSSLAPGGNGGGAPPPKDDLQNPWTTCLDWRSAQPAPELLLKPAKDAVKKQGGDPIDPAAAMTSIPALVAQEEAMRKKIAAAAARNRVSRKAFKALLKKSGLPAEDDKTGAADEKKGKKSRKRDNPDIKKPVDEKWLAQCQRYQQVRGSLGYNAVKFTGMLHPVITLAPGDRDATPWPVGRGRPMHSMSSPIMLTGRTFYGDLLQGASSTPFEFDEAAEQPMASGILNEYEEASDEESDDDS